LYCQYWRLFALRFWSLLNGFISFDWSRAAPHERFADPPPLALGQ